MTDLHRAVLAARARLLKVDRETLVAIHSDLLAWGDELTNLLRRTRGTGRRALVELQAEVERTAADLGNALTGLVDRQRTVTLTDIGRIWEEAGTRITGTTGRRVALDMATLYDSFPRPAFETLIADHAAAAGEEVNAIIRQAFLRGVSPAALATALEPYVQGGENFAVRLGSLGLLEVEVPPDQRGAAKLMRYNAERIAFTETQFARREAELWHWQRDPYIVAVRYTLAPDRGSQKQWDICDTYAKSNLFGLGMGIYPLHRAPSLGHPFCRCELVPVERRGDQLDEPRPAGKWHGGGLVLHDSLSKLAAARVRQHVAGLRP